MDPADLPSPMREKAPPWELHFFITGWALCRACLDKVGQDQSLSTGPSPPVTPTLCWGTQRQLFLFPFIASPLGKFVLFGEQKMPWDGLTDL